LDELVSLREVLFSQVRRPIQFPEPDLSLDLESRRDSDLRTFKHLHQSSALHRENFCATSTIKHLYLIDAYLDLARTRNGYALYLVSRSMFELSAFLHEVRTRLIDAAAHAEDNWRQAGQEFFGTVVRARFATTREDYKVALREAGLSQDRLKPFNIMHCISRLAEDADNEDAEARYAKLCDFVHHNLASATTANAGSAEGDVAVSSGGGAMVMPGGGVFTQYQYPIPSQYEAALNDTAPQFLRDARACVRWLNEIPGSPFQRQLVEQFTGSRLGIPMLRPPLQRSGRQDVGRNEQCPCGSGKKSKRCCGAPPPL
jgi:hypothetical protein